jgi:hypothetical protein
VLESKEVEECLGDVITKEFLLNEPVKETFIRHMGELGGLQYYPHFPRPFYKITKRGNFILKGVQGNNTFQVFFVNYSRETEEMIHEYIGTYKG